MAKRTDCYCAFCKSARKVYVEKSLKFRHVFWSFLLSLACSFLVWQEYNPKSLLFFVVGMMIAEIFMKIRWRLHIACRNCGFDPVLYVKNPDKAAMLVKDFLERRRQDPDFLLRPPLSLPSRPAESATQKSQKAASGKNVSRLV